MSSSAAAAATAAAAASPAAATIAEAQARLGELRQQETAEALAAAALRAAIEALPPGLVKDDKRRDLAERKEALTAIRAAIEKEEARVDAARGMLDQRAGVDLPDAAMERAQRSLYTFYAGEDQALPSGTAFAVEGGFLVTARHCVLGGSPFVAKLDGELLPVKVVRSDQRRDWALLRPKGWELASEDSLPITASKPRLAGRAFIAHLNVGEANMHVRLHDTDPGDAASPQVIAAAREKLAHALVPVDVQLYYRDGIRFKYVASTQGGDSGAVVLLSSSGEAFGMHVEHVNAVRGPRARAQDEGERHLEAYEVAAAARDASESTAHHDEGVLLYPTVGAAMRSLLSQRSGRKRGATSSGAAAATSSSSSGAAAAPSTRKKTR